MEISIVIAVIVAIFIFQTFKIVPQQNAWIVERLGRYDRTLAPGLKFVVPFIERVAYKHSLKEVPLDVPSQVCITRDNTQLQVDGKGRLGAECEDERGPRERGEPRLYAAHHVVSASDTIA